MANHSIADAFRRIAHLFTRATHLLRTSAPDIDNDAHGSTTIDIEWGTRLGRSHHRVVLGWCSVQGQPQRGVVRIAGVA